MTDIYDETLEEIQKAKVMLNEIDYTDKFRHIETSVKGSLDPGCPRCSCHRHCDDCDYDDLKNRELTPTEEEAVEWLFQLVETPVIIKEDK